MSRICRHQPAPTEQQREWAAEIKANGGNLTADELSHSHAFDMIAMCWSRSAANRAIRQRQAEGKWLGAHAHADGHVYVPSQSSGMER